MNSEGGVMGDAIGYLENLWESLLVFLRRGDVPMDSISCEQAIRIVAVGRRNWLFTGSPRGGQAAAILYSIVLSCKRAGVEPCAYLADVLVRVCVHPASRVDELIPRRWRELRAAGTLETLAR